MSQTKKKAHILVVDDDSSLREILEFSFRRLGYEVHCAADSKTAKEILQTHSIDLLISDLQLQHGGGVGFLEQLHQSRPEMHIILLVTGYHDISTKEALARGASAIFSKPFHTRDLQDTLQKLLGAAGTSDAKLKKNSKNSMQNSINRRKSKRIAVQLDTELQLPSHPEAFSATIFNLSVGGMFIVLPRSPYPNINETIQFKIALTGTENVLTGLGIVKWVRTKDTLHLPAGFGIEFTHLSEESKKQIQDLIAKS